MEKSVLFTEWLSQSVKNDLIKSILFSNVGFSMAILFIYIVHAFYNSHRMFVWHIILALCDSLGSWAILIPVFSSDSHIVRYYYLLLYLTSLIGANAILGVCYETFYYHYPPNKRWLWLWSLVCIGICTTAFTDVNLIAWFTLVSALPHIIETINTLIKLNQAKRNTKASIFYYVVLVLLSAWFVLDTIAQSELINRIKISLYPLFSLMHAVWVGYLISRKTFQLQKSQEQILELNHQKEEILRKERQKLEKEISLQIRELKELNEKKDNIYTVIWHDIKTPLSSFHKLSETINIFMKNHQFDKIKEVSDKIDEMGVFIDNMLENLYKWTKYIQKQSIETNLDDLLNHTLPIYKSIASNRGCDMVSDIKINQIILTDPFVLACIVRNLLDNAIKNAVEGAIIKISGKATPEGAEISIENTLTKNQQKSAENVVLFLVSDEKISSTAHNNSLGLMIVKKYAKDNLIMLSAYIENSRLKIRLSIPHKNMLP